MPLVFDAVNSSSSLMRSRIGSVCLATYFLRANGLTRPQKPSRACGCRGCFPVAVVDVVCDVVVWVEGDDCVCDVELSCAKTGTARTPASVRTKSERFFI